MEGVLSLLAEITIGMIVDELREILARFLAILFRRERRLLFALILREKVIAHARDEQRLVNLRKVRIARDDLLATLERRDISLLQFEILPRDIQIV